MRAMVACQMLIFAALLTPATLEAQQVMAGKRAPEFALATVDDAKTKLRLADFRGHPVVISFWATWCPPCRKEMPELAAVYQANRSSGLVVLAVNEEALETDINGRPVYRKKAAHDSSLAKFLREVALPFPVLLDDSEGAAWNRYSAGKLYLPAIFFVDTAGVVRAMFNEIVPADSLAKGLRAILTTQHEE